MKQRKAWTDAEDALLVRLRQEGNDCARIAETLQRTLPSTKSRVDCLVERGVLQSTMKPWTSWEDAKLGSMRDEGASTPEIAQTLGRPLSSTSARIHKLLKLGSLRRLSDPEAKARWHRERARRSERMAHEARGRVVDIPRTADVGYVVGVLFGDGFVLQNGRTIGLKCTDASFAHSFAEALFSAFGERPRTLERTEHEKRVGGRVYHDIRYYEVMLHRRHIVRALREWLGPTSTWDWAIDVTDALSRGPDYCDGLIQGLYDSDGSVSLHGQSGIHIRLGTQPANAVQGRSMSS